jgi:beta-lactamase class A
VENMTKLIQFTILFAVFTLQATAQTTLRQKIEQIVSTKNAVVGVSISDHRGKEILSINGKRHFPFQSVFKFHIALAVLSEMDKGKFSLDQKIEIQKKDLLPDTYSPIRDKYPEGTTLTLAEIMQYTVSMSDNVGCDVLLRIIGGPQAVENYFAKNNFKDVAIKFNEETQQGKWELQFENWTTPKTSNKVLHAFFDNKKKPLFKSSHDFIWKTMRETSTGVNRLKAQLPENTVVAHKTGSSGTNKQTGITAAVNDIGIVFLPNGQHFFISVFVTDSKENADTNEKIIADIGKAAWDYFTLESK